MKLNKREITVDVPAGMHINEISRLAVIMAMEEETDVKFIHNGNAFTACYKDILERAIK